MAALRSPSPSAGSPPPAASPFARAAARPRRPMSKEDENTGSSRPAASASRTSRVDARPDGSTLRIKRGWFLVAPGSHALLLVGGRTARVRMTKQKSSPRAAPATCACRPRKVRAPNWTVQHPRCPEPPPDPKAAAAIQRMLGTRTQMWYRSSDNVEKSFCFSTIVSAKTGVLLPQHQCKHPSAEGASYSNHYGTSFSLGP